MKKNSKITGLALLAASFYFASGTAAVAQDDLEFYKQKVETVASVLEPITGLKADISVVSNPGFDAYVLPDGKIILTTGLLSACQSDDEMAFVIAHEISHVIAKDYTRKRFPELASSKDMPDFQLREINADINAVYYGRKAGYNPEALVNILTRIAPESNITIKKRLETLTGYLNSLRK